MKQSVYRYKAILVAMISLVVMCGCAEKEIDTPTKQVDKLYFKQTMDGQKEEQLNSRAYTGDIEFEARGFTVAGYRTNGVFSVSNPNSLPFPNVFDWTDPGVDPSVIKIAIDNSETNPDRKYWTWLPKFSLSPVYNISYFAWSSSEDNTITTATSSAADKGYPWIDAKVGAANTNQPDIVGALSMNHNTDYTVSAIDLDFKHLLSKMSFRVKSSNGMAANITKAECVYGKSAVYSKARFTFDGTADVGSWGDHKDYLAEGAVTPGNWSNATITATPGLLGSMTLIPQSLTDQALSLNITYTTTQGGATSQPITHNVPLKAIDLKPGKNYVYTLDLNANEITFKVKVEGWIEMIGTDKGLPLVPGEMDPDVLLLLEGTDPPYTTADGSKYWLDRSGWNNHCQIMGKDQYSNSYSFDITYDQAAKGYNIPAVNANGNLYNHIRIPDLGTTSGDFTYELVCNQTLGGSEDPYPFILSRTPQGSFGGSAISNYIFYPDIAFISDKGMMYWATSTGDESFYIRMGAFNGYNTKAYYYGVRSKANLIKIGFNDTHMAARHAGQSQDSGWDINGGFIGPKFKGTIHYLKLMKKASSEDELRANYAELKIKYSIPQSNAPANHYLPPVADQGLLFAFDGRKAPTNNGNTWADLTGAGYDMTTYSQGNGRYDSSIKAIVHTGGESNCWKIDKDISGLSQWCVEAVVNIPSNISTGADRPLFFFGTGRETYEWNKYIYLAYPSSNGYPGYKGFNTDYLAINWYISSLQAKHKLTINRKDALTELLYNTGSRHTAWSTGTSPTMDVIWIGARAGDSNAWVGNMYAFRMYNRHLTAAELELNKEYDKKSHNF